MQLADLTSHARWIARAYQRRGLTVLAKPSGRGFALMTIPDSSINCQAMKKYGWDIVYPDRKET